MYADLSEVPLVVLTLLVTLLAYYTLCGCAGVAMLHSWPAGVKLTLAAQIPQILQVQTDTFVLAIISGLSAVVYAAGGEFGVAVGFGSKFSILFGDVAGSTGFAVNLVAAAIVLYMVRCGAAHSRWNGV